MDSRKIALPGELLEDRKGRKIGVGVFVENDKVYSKVLGIPRISDLEISVIPLSGVYVPSVGDRVIGVVETTEISGWLININSPYGAFLPIAEGVEDYVDLARVDLSRYFDIGDVIFCRISRVTKNKTTQASMRDMYAKKLYGGTIVKITPSKIPRVIGKEGSMINLIKNKTKCEIIAGQNGMVWIKGDNKAKALEAILTIDKESHILGLTEKVEKILGE